MDTLYSTIDHYGLEVSSIIRYNYSHKWHITRVVFDMDKCPNVKNRVHGARYFEVAFHGDLVDDITTIKEFSESKLGQLL